MNHQDASLTTRPKPPGVDRRHWMQMKDAFYDDQNARLHDCVRDDDMSTLRELVSRCGTGTGTGTGTGELDLNYCDLDFGSALQVAVLCNNMTAVDILIDAGASPWVCHGSIEPKTTAMDVAIQKGNHGMFTRICDKTVLRVDKTWQQRCRALLCRTSLNGQAAMVKDVLSWADDWSEATLEDALGNAVSGWHVEVVRLLLSFFSYSPLCLDSALWDAADFRSDLLSHPRAECTGLDYTNQQLLISCLVEAGADPNNSASRQGNIVIDTATWIDLVGALKALLENGANANSRGAAGETALHHLGSPAHMKKGPWRYLHEAGIRLLLQHGASVMIQDDSGSTPLHYAAFGSNMHIFSIYTTGLPADSSDSNALNSVRNNSGETLLHWAAAGKKIDIVLFLRPSGADVNAANENGWTPLMCALAPSTANEAVRSCSYTTLQAVRSILGHGANPLTCTAEGWTPLHCLSLYLDHSGSNDDLASLAEHFISNLFQLILGLPC